MAPIDEETPLRGFASPPCLAHEISPTHFDPCFVDPQQVLDVKRWRRAERDRLLSERKTLKSAGRRTAAKAIATHLDRFLADHFDNLKEITISGWWPIKAELDLRFWLEGLAEKGAQAALPLVKERDTPLAFRVWTPTTPMERGFWNIPVPAEGPEVVPDVILAPLVGWDAMAYRLGYGGGYFDRTLAALSSGPLSIGIGLQDARLPTIFPQPHDIPMAAIITEAGLHLPKSSACRD